MKLLTFGVLLLALTGCPWAQDTQSTPTRPPASSGVRSHHDVVKPDLLATRERQAQIQEMQSEIAKMRSKLDQMKANVARMDSGATQDEARLNIDLWEGMIGHMENMSKMMSDHGSIEMGMMHGGMKGMHCCAGMKDGKGCCGGNKCTKAGQSSGEPMPPDSDK